MNTAKENKDKIAVLLLAFGGPVSFEEVEPFIKNVTGGKISREKIDEVSERYKRIGGKSPLLEITKKQAGALENNLNKDGNRFSVFVGMRYWHPFTADVLKLIIEKNMKNIIVLPMTPYYSRISTEGYFNDFTKSLSQVNSKIRYTFIKSFHKQPFFIEAFNKLITEEKNKFSGKDPDIIFSVHSIPKKLIDDGDPYLSQVKETVETILNKTGTTKWHLAFQSKGASHMEWLGPDVSSILRKIKESNRKDVLFAPVGFISDHIETLYDIDILYKNEALDLGLNFRRVPSLNVDPLFIKALEELVKEHSSSLQENQK